MRKLLPLLTLLLLAGCRGRIFHASDFLVHIDSIVAPSEVASTEPLRVLFYGTVGVTNCFSFRGFESRRDESNHNVVVWAMGRYESTGSCSYREVLLEGEPHHVPPPFSHPLLLTVIQPEGEPITREIAVR